MTPAATVAWDPAQYLRFRDERLRPALDLLGRLPELAPDTVADLGCGAGNVTALLKARFPHADVLGVDASASMLAAARTAAPGCRFALADLTAWTAPSPPALLFSNAALHWLPDHASLLPRLLAMLAPGGWLAVQLPAMHDAPLRRLQAELARQGRWRARLAGIAAPPPILAAAEYWDMLRPIAAELDVWETTYLHELAGEDAVVAWAAGSSLLPYLEALTGDERRDFRAAYAAALRPHYAPRADGTTLLPFRRLFLLARS